MGRFCGGDSPEVGIMSVKRATDDLLKRPKSTNPLSYGHSSVTISSNKECSQLSKPHNSSVPAHRFARKVYSYEQLCFSRDQRTSRFYAR